MSAEPRGRAGWIPHRERHRTGRSGWLRAAVLGADDGIVSTASLLVVVAAATASRGVVITAGIAGLVAGATTMAAGEYVSVSSQRDAERGDLAKERAELASVPAAELDELTQIYLDRGLSAATARQVAVELTARDALAAHARDDPGLTEALRAPLLPAAAYWAVRFMAGALLPLVAVLLAPPRAPDRDRQRGSRCSLWPARGAGRSGRRGKPDSRRCAGQYIGGGVAMAATASTGWLVGATGL